MVTLVVCRLLIFIDAVWSQILSVETCNDIMVNARLIKHGSLLTYWSRPRCPCGRLTSDGRVREYVSDGGTLLEVVEMAGNNPSDVDAGKANELRVWI
eukprot:g43492.t1